MQCSIAAQLVLSCSVLLHCWFSGVYFTCTVGDERVKKKKEKEKKVFKVCWILTPRWWPADSLPVKWFSLIVADGEKSSEEKYAVEGDVVGVLQLAQTVTTQKKVLRMGMNPAHPLDQGEGVWSWEKTMMWYWLWWQGLRTSVRS